MYNLLFWTLLISIFFSLFIKFNPQFTTKMHRYIQQLIADFNKAEQDPVKEPDFGSSYEDFEKR